MAKKRTVKVTPTYRVVIRPLTAEEGGGWLATYPDLPGCMGDGATAEMALADAREASTLWLKSAKADGIAIPPAENTRRYSGKLPLRVKPDIHRALARRAADQGTSINALIGEIVERAIALNQSPNRS